MKNSLFLLCLLMPGFFANSQSADSLRLNDIQIIGSHNSYKKLPDAQVMKFMMKFRKKLGRKLDPTELDYGHLPIDSQFGPYNMRGLEIDIYNDPPGGLFYKRRINAFVHGEHQRSGIEALRKPGMKVLHIKDVDYQTNYYTFTDALKAIKQWSDAHPSHLPLFINVETKDKGPADYSKTLRFLGFKRTIPFDAQACDSIDAEIKSVFGSELKNVITPDRLRGKYTTLDEMATQHGWPLLSESRGKIIFIMLGDAKDIYAAGHASLSGRAACIYAKPGTPECAFVMRDNPERDSLIITKLVKQGYLVRTRSDAGTTESRTNDSTRKFAAFNSGAQITSTDYYKPDLRFSNFTVQWDGVHAGRVNPVTRPNSKNVWLEEKGP